MKNYYQILGLEEGATLDKIKSAYRKYAAKFHPDKHGDDEFFKERFQEIQEAYEYLLEHYKDIDDETESNEDEYRLTSGNIILFECFPKEVQVGDTITIKWKVNHPCNCLLEMNNGYSTWNDEDMPLYGEKHIKVNRINEKIEIRIRIYNSCSNAYKSLTIYKINSTDIDYYLLINGRKEGPFKISELKSKDLKSSSLVWHRNLREDWIKAEELPELKRILNEIPPEIPKMPDTYLVWAILATIFCCLPFGIAGIVNAIKVSETYEVGNYTEAENYSKKAEQWSLIAAISGISLLLLIIVIILIITFSNYAYLQNVIEIWTD